MTSVTATAPAPDLQQPTTLLSHPISSNTELTSHAVPVSNHAATAKRSLVSVGSAYKLAADGRTLRRLKGTLPILVRGHAVSLVNPQTQTPIQSFTLATTDAPVTAPLTLLRPLGGGRSLRTTYIALKPQPAASRTSSTSTSSSSHVSLSNSAASEIRVFVEELSAKGKETAQISFRTESLVVEGAVQLIQPLSDGRLMLSHSDDSLTILSHPPLALDDTVSVENTTTTLQVSNRVTPSSAIDANVASSHAVYHFNASLLDASSAKKLVANSGQVEEASLLALRVSIMSPSIVVASNTANVDDSKKKRKATRSRKSAIEVIDAAESEQIAVGQTVPSGPLELEVTAFSKSVDSLEDANLSVTRLGKVMVPGLEDAEEVCDVHFHPDGRLVTLTRNGHIHVHLLTLSSAGPSVSETKRLQIPRFASTSSHSNCLINLSGDHLLLVGLPRPLATSAPASATKERMVALMVDLELDAVLCSIDWPVPFATGSNLQSSTMVSASRIAGSAVVLVVGPTPGTGTGTGDSTVTSQQRRCSVLTLPFMVPEASILRHALGKGELTSRWLGLDVDASRGAVVLDDAAVASTDARRKGLLSHLRELQTSASVADSASLDESMNASVTEWLSHETADGRTLEAVSRPEDATFFGSLLDLLLPDTASPASSSSRPFARNAVKTLLEERRVHASVFASLDAGSNSSLALKTAPFWKRLRSRGDVELLRVAVQNVTDISEDELVAVLVSAMDTLAKKPATSPNDQVRELVKLLREVVKVPVSRAALRSALKQQVRQVGDVVALLQICNIWLAAAARRPMDPDSKLVSLADGATGDMQKLTSELPKKSRSRGGKHTTSATSKADESGSGFGEIPDADSALSFASDVMDTFFPLLISTASSYQVLRALSKTISSYVGMVSGLRTLEAPLSAFAKLDQELTLELRRAQQLSRAAGQPQPLSSGGTMISSGNMKVSTSAKTPANLLRAETGGGLGIRLGTQTTQKSRRLESFEQSMLVGAYSLERLEL
ncbi:hypothetical protein BCV70DRAFT_202015 [Testicularia cyperi]|uniref:Uncharacterized protein n=1 Tax=Testicularia cyperi TaxID=1882483 RepID=A0A317XK46_9BASI|nr:hypothetical protein BCV70DRAFT_202015 [Testicularia cyperi]